MSSGNDKNSTTAGLGVVWLDGGTGTDTLTIDYSTVSGPIVYGTYYDWNYLTDEAFSTIYYKNYEFLNITGGSDADNLYGTSPSAGVGGNDTLIGGGGNDTLSGYLGADIINGGLGLADVWAVDYSSLGADIDVILNASGITGGTGTVYTVGATQAKISNIEALNITTSSGNDLINTSAVLGNDNIYTGAGDDDIRPGLGFDRVDAGEGVDSLTLNYSTKSEDIIRYDIGYGWWRMQDGDMPTTSIDYFQGNIENFNITGGTGNDTLSGRSDYDGNDKLVGGLGNDTLYGYGGVDTIDGGAGTDTWRVVYGGDQGNVDIAINIATTLQTTNTGATISGIEQLIADTSVGNDSLVCNPGIFNDIINTGGGDDTITTGRGVDTINAGGQGSAAGDTLIINWSAVTTNISNIDNGYGWRLYNSGSGDSVNYLDVETYFVTGGSGNDSLLGFGGNDTFNSGSGNDLINSGTGKATVNGGSGTDYWQADVSGILAGLVVNAKASQDILDPITGAITTQGVAQGTGAGHSIRNIEGFNITSGNGKDSLNNEGYSTNDAVSTNGGDDSVSLGLGYDTANGGDGIDTLNVDFHTATTPVKAVDAGYGWWLWSDKANTTSIKFINFEKYNIQGGSASDNLSGSTNNDNLIGNNGNDILNGVAGKDTINGGLGNDTWQANYNGGTSPLSLVLNASGNGSLKTTGTSTVWASLTSIENINLTTSSLSDIVDTSALHGNDSVNTMGGNDTVRLGDGKDVANGGDGNDLLIFNFSSSTTAIKTVDQGYGWWKYSDSNNVNSISYINFENFDITGGSGSDRLSGSDGADLIKGGAGNDIITGNGGDDVLTGGAGNDIFVFASSGSNGIDTITDANSGDTIRIIGRNFAVGSHPTLGEGTTVGNNTVKLKVDSVNHTTTLYIGVDDTAGPADIFIELNGDQYGTTPALALKAFTLSGQDILINKGSTTIGSGTINGTDGNDSLVGGATADKLIGKVGNDTLIGGDGNDTLIGGLGADVLTGGAGNDHFAISSIWDSTPGNVFHDIITDFSAGDTIDLLAIDSNPYLANRQGFTFINTDFTGIAGQVRYDATNSFVLIDVNGDLSADIEIKLLGTHTINSTSFNL